MRKRVPLVLIVDDDPDVRETLQDVLRDEGIEAVSADNGAAALQYLHSHAMPAAILLDLSMPVMNGAAFAKQLAGSRFESIPIVLITSERPEWGYPMVKSVLHKPLDLEKVLTTVHAVTTPAQAAE